MREETFQEMLDSMTPEQLKGFRDFMDRESRPCRTQGQIEGIEADFGAAYVGTWGRKGNMPIIYRWTGERLSNGAVDFVVPVLDDELVRLLQDRIEGKYRGPKWANTFEVGERIRAVQGLFLF
jgi:hypothetical protein